MNAKYVIIRQGEMEVPVVFSSLLQHDKVAGTCHITSAGFCELGAAGKWVVSGRSDILGFCARPQDAEILNAHLLNINLARPTLVAGKMD